MGLVEKYGRARESQNHSDDSEEEGSPKRLIARVRIQSQQVVWQSQDDARTARDHRLHKTRTGNLEVGRGCAQGQGVVEGRF